MLMLLGLSGLVVFSRDFGQCRKGKQNTKTVPSRFSSTYDGMPSATTCMKVDWQWHWAGHGLAKFRYACTMYFFQDDATAPRRLLSNVGLRYLRVNPMIRFETREPIATPKTCRSISLSKFGSDLKNTRENTEAAVS